MAQLEDSVTLTNFDIEDYCRKLGENEKACRIFGQRPGERINRINSLIKSIFRLLRKKLYLKNPDLDILEEIENEKNCKNIDSHEIWD